MDDLPTTMANDERDEETGEFTSKYDDEAFVDAIRETGGAASTAEVAEAVNAPHSTAFHRLDRLREAGDISSRTVGNSTLWVVDGE
jgi:uncharacterized membrane protein